jgi:transcriptional regulator with XRE-family HTH domain
MEMFGSYLKKLRNDAALSLNDVYEQSGITDSKLSRMERGEGKPLEPMELHKLAQLYHVNVIPLYIRAGYLTEQDLVDYKLVFHGAELLTEEEIHSIQTQINLLVKRKKVSAP